METDKSCCKIEICDNHTGKMVGINSISTAVLANEFCKKQRAIAGSICSHCYAESMSRMYGLLNEKLLRNTEALTSSILAEDELPDTTGCDIFRFESFGDINNETQLINYLNIVKKNPGTRFTLYTKRYALVGEYFSRVSVEVPTNFTLVLSSLMVNHKISLEKFVAMFKLEGKFRRGQVKIFTVYDYDYIVKHYEELNLNCGSRYCYGCRFCYDENRVEEISEILKSDQARVEAFVKTHDPRYIDEQLDILSCLDDVY